MGYGEPLDRSRNFRVYDGLNNEPRVVILHEPAAQAAAPPEKKKGLRSTEFKKIFVAVVMLIGLYSMTESDMFLHMKKKSPTFITKGEENYERVEPSLFAKMFCRGNQRPHFCD